MPLSKKKKSVMNKLKSLVTVFVASAIFLSGCTLKKMVKMAQEQQLAVTPSPVEMHGNQVEFEMSAMLPLKMLKKNTIYTVNAYYQFGDQKLDLGKIEFKSADYADKTIQPKVSETFKFDYLPEHRRGKVMVMGTAAKVTGKSLPTPSMEVADGVITTSELVLDEVKPAYAFHGYNNQEELIPTNVEFFFASGSARLTTKEFRGDQGKKMGMFIADKKVTRTVNIFGHHSPEGTEAINTDLSNDRAKAIETFYRKEMKKYDYKDMADSIKFVLKPTTLDWKMFRDAVKATTVLDEGQKTQVLNIIDVKGADFVSQEKELQGLSFYKTIKSKIYPAIRTAKTEILSVKEKKTDAEISALASQIVKGDSTTDSLNVEELGYAATLTTDLKEKEGIYLELTKRGQTWESHNNLAALYLEQAIAAADADKAALVDKAKAQLEISVKKEEAAANLANLAVAKTMSGDFEGAKEDAKKALDKNPNADLVKDIKSNLAPQFIRSGDYAQAIKALETSSLTATSKYNMGLAQLLTKDFDTAAKKFATVNTEDDKNAHAYYAAAVTAARTGDESTMAARLKKSIELNSDLRARAIDDLEFMKYFTSQSFIDAIK